eukprot:319586_1
MGACQCPDDVRNMEDWRMLCYDSTDNPEQTCKLHSWTDDPYPNYWLYTYGCNNRFRWQFKTLSHAQDYTFRCSSKYGDFLMGESTIRDENDVCCAVPCGHGLTLDHPCLNVQSEKSPWYQ